MFAVLTSLVDASYPYVSLSFCLVHISFVHIVYLLRVRVCAYVLFVGLGVQRHLLNYEQFQSSCHLVY